MLLVWVPFRYGLSPVPFLFGACTDEGVAGFGGGGGVMYRDDHVAVELGNDAGSGVAGGGFC